MEKAKFSQRSNRFWTILIIALLFVWLSAAPARVRADDGAPDTPPPGPVFPSEALRQALRLDPVTLTLDNAIYLPFTVTSRVSFQVNPQNRAESLNFYETVYLRATPDENWTGNHATCSPGSTSDAFKAAVLQRINYYRAMGGVPPVTLSADSNYYAQAAAFLMSVNQDLDHTPPSTWDCYSADAATGASSSNLALGSYGPEAINGYMADPGAGNTAMGHRRWILYPQTKEMGTGDVPYVSGYWPTNALRVFDSHMWEPRPTTREAYVAWPPPGYVPRPVVFSRWSFSYAGANFSSASVTVTTGGSNVPLTKFPVVTGYGENTLAWEMSSLNGSGDKSYQVSISGVTISGSPRSFDYTVILFTP